jgi:TIR domain
MTAVGDYEYDCFISHASEDKDEVARPLAERLREARYRVWYDEFSLQLGDRLTESINRGLATSRYGIVILSPRFVERPWPKHELAGLTALMLDGRLKLLPVWHEIGHAEVLAFSPPLADRVGVPTSFGMDRVIADIIRAVEPEVEARRRVEQADLAVGRALFVIRGQDTEGGDRILVYKDRVWDCLLLPNQAVEGRQLEAQDDSYLCDRLSRFLGLEPGAVHATHLEHHDLRSRKYSQSRKRLTTYDFYLFATRCEGDGALCALTFTVGATEYCWLTLEELQSSQNADRNQDVFGHLRATPEILELTPVSCAALKAG